MSSKTYIEYNVHVADQFVESIDEAANTRYYLFASKHRDYTESSTPAPSSTISNSVHQTYDEMLFGKLITSSDVSLGIVKRLWANNTVYAAYDDTAANTQHKDLQRMNGVEMVDNQREPADFYPTHPVITQMLLDR